MRVALYNQMFGLNGRSLISNILGHYFVHWQKNSKRVFSRIDLDEGIKIVKESNADLLGICEIYEGQEEKIVEEFKKLLKN